MKWDFELTDGERLMINPSGFWSVRVHSDLRSGVGDMIYHAYLTLADGTLKQTYITGQALDELRAVYAREELDAALAE